MRFEVRDVDGEAFLGMQATTAEDVPTSVYPVGTSDTGLAGYAEDLRALGASVRAIAFRMGSYCSLALAPDQPDASGEPASRNVAPAGRWRPQDYVEESAAVLDWVCSRTDLDRDWVADVVRDIRHVVEVLVTNDVTVLAPPLVLHRLGDPVVDALARRLDDATWKPVGAENVNQGLSAARRRLPSGLR